MIEFICHDYGFECDFKAKEENAVEAIDQFGKHTLDEHGIEYTKEALMQFILRKQG